MAGTGEDWLRARVERLSGQRVSDCYQCGKCSGNCPVAPEMDYLPSQLMRLVQSGRTAEALASRAIWLCDGCLTCSSRCPRDIDVARVIDGLRAISRRDLDEMGIFAETFLSGIRRMGRANELPLGLMFNLRRRKPLDNSDVALKLFRRGKLPLIPRRAGSLSAVFERVRRLESSTQAEEGMEP